MPTASELVLVPSQVYTEGTGSSHAPYIIASDIVGGISATAWTDGSDASYGKCDASRTARATYSKWSDVDSSIDPSWVTAIGVRFRARCDTDGIYFIVQLFGQVSKLLSNPFYGYTAPTPAALLMVTANTWTDFDYVIQDNEYDVAGWAPDRVLSTLEQTYVYVRTVPVSDKTGEFTGPEVIEVSEQAIVIYYTRPDDGPPPDDIAANIPPQRIHPRGDGLGMSSGRRTYPPVPSRQFGNRAAGAVYL